MKEQLDALGVELNTALVNMCSVAVSGPAVVPMGRAIEAVNNSIQTLKKLREKLEETASGSAEET